MFVASTVRLYVPGGICLSRNRPSESVVAVNANPLSTSTSVTFADGTAAAEGSVTVPDNDPVYNCALAFGASPKKTKQAAVSINFVAKTTDPGLFVVSTPTPPDPIRFIPISMPLLL